MSRLRPSPLVLALLLASGCASPLRMSRLRPDYAQQDQKATKRLVVVTSPLPADSEAVGQLWSTIAQRYVNQNRDFIAKEARVVPAGDFQPASACGEGLEGVLLLKPQKVEQKESGVEASVLAQLLRCTDGAEVWAAEAGGSWSSLDALYESQRDQYVAKMGAEVGPFVAPSSRLLKTVLDTLPQPVLTEEDVSEKIELGE